MKLEVLEKTEHLHHAYLVVGDSLRGGEQVLGVLEGRGIKTKGNPDVLALSFSELLVDDVRDSILPFAALSPIVDRKYLVISFSKANTAAQNALLKAVEESLGHSVFFFSIDAVGHILPTLRSRCIAVTAFSEQRSAFSDEAEEFLKAKYPERLAAVEKMASYISKTQDREPVRAFLRTLLGVAHRAKLPPRAVRDIMNAGEYLRQSGSSAKSVLGHLAVSLPLGQ